MNNTAPTVDKQNATNNAVSSALPNWTKEQFEASVKRNGTQTAKGVTRERKMLNRAKLIANVCAEYRSHFPAIYGKTERLPSEVFAMVEDAVDMFISDALTSVHTGNVLSVRRAFYHKKNDMEVTERVTITGENTLALKEQHLGVTIFITQAEKRLKDLESKPTPDLDREKQVKESLMRLNVTKTFIEAELKRQGELGK